MDRFPLSSHEAMTIQDCLHNCTLEKDCDLANWRKDGGGLGTCTMMLRAGTNLAVEDDMGIVLMPRCGKIHLIP